MGAHVFITPGCCIKSGKRSETSSGSAFLKACSRREIDSEGVLQSAIISASGILNSL